MLKHQGVVDKRHVCEPVELLSCISEVVCGTCSGEPVLQYWQKWDIFVNTSQKYQAKFDFVRKITPSWIEYVGKKSSC